MSGNPTGGYSTSVYRAVSPLLHVVVVVVPFMILLYSAAREYFHGIFERESEIQAAGLIVCNRVYTLKIIGIPVICFSRAMKINALLMLYIYPMKLCIVVCVSIFSEIIAFINFREIVGKFIKDTCGSR